MTQSLPQIKIGIDARLALFDDRGWGRYAEGLLLAFAQRPDLRIKCLFPDSPSANRLAERLKGSPLEIVTRPFQLSSPSQIYRMPEYQVDPLEYLGDVDILHSLTRFAAPSKVKSLVATVHDIAPLSSNPFKLAYKEPTIEALEYLKSRRTQIIAVSNFTRDELVHLGGMDPSRITVIYEGVCTTLLNSKSFHHPPSPYVFYVGGGNPNKNLLRLIEAMGLVQKRGSLGLVIAGKASWEHESLQAHYQQHSDWLTYLSYINDEDLAACYRGAEVVVVPSLHEGFGLPLLEAMTLGVAVACSDIPVFREVAGDGAVFFDPLSPIKMAETISALVGSSNLRRESIAKARHRSSQFSWEITAEQTLELYRKAHS